jgi:hypothetical protein
MVTAGLLWNTDAFIDTPYTGRTGFDHGVGHLVSMTAPNQQ